MMNKRNIPCFVAMVAMAWAPASFAIEKSKAELIVGYYKTKHNSDTEKPFILSKNEDGKSWSFLSKLPSLGDSQVFYTVDCMGATCFVGANNYSSAPFPSLLKTEDAGKSWSIVTNIAQVPKNFGSNVKKIICEGETCLGVGDYSVMEGESPLILVSHDTGISWRSVNEIKDRPVSNDMGIRDFVTCDQHLCLSMLSVFKEHEYAFPIVSQDKGDTWTFIKNIVDMPANKAQSFYDGKCKGNTCVSGGEYIALNEEYKPKPVLIASYDQGNHWTAIQDIEGIPTITVGSIMTIFSKDSAWFAVGGYQTSADKTIRPLILKSEDDGRRWRFVKTVPTNSGRTLNYISDISCQDGFCVAAGGNGYGREYAMPSILVSDDNGNSFSFARNISYLPNMRGGIIKKIRCNESTCTAIGLYFGPKSHTTNYDDCYPLVLTSTDKGKSWAYVPVKDLPTDLSSLYVYSGN